MSTTINLQITSTNQMGQALYTDEFDVSRKAEFEFNDMLLSDGEQVLSISKLLPITKIICSSEGMLLKVNDNSIPVSGVLLWDIEPTYGATISGVSVSATSEIPTDVKISLIGV